MSYLQPPNACWFPTAAEASSQATSGEDSLSQMLPDTAGVQPDFAMVMSNSFLPAASSASGLRDALAGLGPGSTGPQVHRLQSILKRWNPQLGVVVNGRFDETTRRAVTLYRAIYGSAPPEGRVDAATSDQLLKMEDGSFWKSPPLKTTAQKMLYEASRKLGTPYRMGGNGDSSIDCGMLTSQAMQAAGVGAGSTRLADEQFRLASQGQGGLSLKKQPQPGDLVFFRVPTGQSGVAYGGVTHVGLYVGQNTMLAASSGAGKVVLQDLQAMQPYVAGYGRP